MLSAILFILRNQLGEHTFKVIPFSDNIALSTEEGAQAYVKLVVWRHVELELLLTRLPQDIVDVDQRVVSFLIRDETIEFLACVVCAQF